MKTVIVETKDKKVIIEKNGNKIKVKTTNCTTKDVKEIGRMLLEDYKYFDD